VFVPDRLFHPGLMFVANAGFYLRVEHMKGASLGQAPVFLLNNILGWKSMSGLNTPAY